MTAAPSPSIAQASVRPLLWDALRLLHPFWPLAVLGVTAGAVGGAAAAWMLAAINSALHQPEGLSWPLLAAFAGLSVLSVGGTAVAGALNSAVGQKIIAALRKDISARILRTPLATLEAHRPHRLMAVLTNDVDTVSAFTFNFSGYVAAFAVTLGSFAYLLMLSPVVFALALCSLFIGIGINLVAKRIWIRDYERVRIDQDELHKQYRAITDGGKELKMSRPRRARIYGELLSGAADRIATLKSRAMGLFWIADALGSAIFFVALGLLLAGQRKLGVDAEAISGAVIVLLYVKAPVAQLAGALPMLDQARIAFARVAALSADLDRHEPNIPLIAADDRAAGVAMTHSVALDGVTYAFPAKAGASPFVLGPIDLAIGAGELVFIVGDNGSGKTTLMKLLLGLYAPQEGRILLDGAPVATENRDAYRQLFTTVFSDYYLFDDLMPLATTEAAQAHLARLGLSGKLKVEDGRFTSTDLSTGQRKRLALVHAYLERRPVLVTDEWAADQDPDFRRLFYEELLPALKAEGRSLLVISHDDRYFGVADRIVRMKDGRIVSDAPPPPADTPEPRPAEALERS